MNLEKWLNKHFAYMRFSERTDVHFFRGWVTGPVLKWGWTSRSMIASVHPATAPHTESLVVIIHYDLFGVGFAASAVPPWVGYSPSHLEDNFYVRNAESYLQATTSSLELSSAR